MDFYTYHYLQVHQQAFTLVGYGITIAASLLVLYYSWRYFRHRFVTRYRDLSVILLLIVLILVGVQVEQVLAKHWLSTKINGRPIKSFPLSWPWLKITTLNLAR